jgi:Mg-chelatase subunit ChlD
MGEPALLMMETDKLVAGGGTPMFECLRQVINELSITRGVVVSDGEATDLTDRYAEDDGGDEKTPIRKAIKSWIDSDTPIDTVHIGDSAGGESTLRIIAELTGGVYLKFKDSSQFGQAFKYLTPTYRAQLFLPGAANAIGADEIKK